MSKKISTEETDLKWWEVWCENLTVADFPDEFYYRADRITDVGKFLKKMRKDIEKGVRLSKRNSIRLMTVNNRHIIQGKTRRV